METQTSKNETEFTSSNLELMYSTEHITTRVNEIGEQITKEYQDKDLVLIGVLKGSCVFMADLMRAIDLQMAIDFMAVASYKGTQSSGDVEILKDLTNSIRGKDIIVCEDIIDTGLTLTRLVEILGTRGANSIKIATLLDKPEPRINKELKVDYCGFTIPNKFVVGYGLDVDGRFRNLPFISVVKDPSLL